MRKSPKTIRHTQYAPFWNGNAYNVWLYSYVTGHRFKKYKTEFATIESAWDFIDWLNEYDNIKH